MDRIILKNGKGLYIHIPFCTKICTYCDFCKKLKSFYNHNDYIDSLINEIEYKNIDFNNIDTIYIGGGTPSCIEYNALKKLLIYINDKISSNENLKEYTIECNPEDINDKILQLFQKNKINRISIGVQTTNDKILEKINRNHKKEDIDKSLKKVYQYFNNINIDLMFNLPKQEKNDIIESLKFIQKNNEIITHVSFYSLILEENTALKNNYEENFTEDEEAEIYRLIQDEMKKMGYYQYEISNFAKKNKESIHNLKYWQNKEYYGVGIGAAQKIENIRKTNTKSIKEYEEYYLNKRYNKEIKLYEKQNISENDKLIETIYLGLRTKKGIDISVLLDNNIKYNDQYFNEYLEGNIKKIAIKEKYFFLSTNIILDLLEQIEGW